MAAADGGITEGALAARRPSGPRGIGGTRGLAGHVGALGGPRPVLAHALWQASEGATGVTFNV